MTRKEASSRNPDARERAGSLVPGASKRSRGPEASEASAPARNTRSRHIEPAAQQGRLQDFGGRLSSPAAPPTPAVGEIVNSDEDIDDEDVQEAEQEAAQAGTQDEAQRAGTAHKELQRVDAGQDLNRNICNGFQNMSTQLTQVLRTAERIAVAAEGSGNPLGGRHRTSQRTTMDDILEEEDKRNKTPVLHASTKEEMHRQLWHLCLHVSFYVATVPDWQRDYILPAIVQCTKPDPPEENTGIHTFYVQEFRRMGNRMRCPAMKAIGEVGIKSSFSWSSDDRETTPELLKVGPWAQPSQEWSQPKNEYLMASTPFTPTGDDDRTAATPRFRCTVRNGVLDDYGRPWHRQMLLDSWLFLRYGVIAPADLHKRENCLACIPDNFILSCESLLIYFLSQDRPDADIDDKSGPTDIISTFRHLQKTSPISQRSSRFRTQASYHCEETFPWQLREPKVPRVGKGEMKWFERGGHLQRPARLTPEIAADMNIVV